MFLYELLITVHTIYSTQLWSSYVDYYKQADKLLYTLKTAIYYTKQELNKLTVFLSGTRNYVQSRYKKR
jgi:hypothetical protein